MNLGTDQVNYTTLKEQAKRTIMAIKAENEVTYNPL